MNEGLDDKGQGRLRSVMSSGRRTMRRACVAGGVHPRQYILIDRLSCHVVRELSGCRTWQTQNLRSCWHTPRRCIIARKAALFCDGAERRQRRLQGQHMEDAHAFHHVCHACACMQVAMCDVHVGAVQGCVCKNTRWSRLPAEIWNIASRGLSCMHACMRAVNVHVNRCVHQTLHHQHQPLQGRESPRPVEKRRAKCPLPTAKPWLNGGCPRSSGQHNRGNAK